MDVYIAHATNRQGDKYMQQDTDVGDQHTVIISDTDKKQAGRQDSQKRQE